MNIRKTIEFIQTPAGASVFGIAGLLIGCGVIFSVRGATEEVAAVKKQKDLVPLAEIKLNPETPVTYTTKLPFAASSDSTGSETRKLLVEDKGNKGKAIGIAPPPPSPAQRPSMQFLPVLPEDKPVTSPTVLASAYHPQETSVIEPNGLFAPYGRMIRAELVTSVDSAELSTPVVGLVTRNLEWNHKILIPANSELHCIAAPNRERNRIEVTGSWVVVLAKGSMYPEGSELTLQGTALDQDHDVTNNTFGPNDASAGLRGTILTSANGMDSVKLFAATFLAGAAQGLTQTNGNIYGTETIVPSFRSAGLQGSRELLENYAEQIQKQIEKNGSYVHVPAGKQFYLYVRQPILMEKAKLGATLSSPKLTNAERKLEEQKPDITALLAKRLEGVAQKEEQRQPATPYAYPAYPNTYGQPYQTARPTTATPVYPIPTKR